MARKSLADKLLVKPGQSLALINAQILGRRFTPFTHLAHLWAKIGAALAAC